MTSPSFPETAFRFASESQYSQLKEPENRGTGNAVLHHSRCRGGKERKDKAFPQERPGAISWELEHISALGFKLRSYEDPSIPFKMRSQSNRGYLVS